MFAIFRALASLIWLTLLVRWLASLKARVRSPRSHAVANAPSRWFTPRVPREAKKPNPSTLMRSGTHSGCTPFKRSFHRYPKAGGRGEAAPVYWTCCRPSSYRSRLDVPSHRAALPVGDRPPCRPAPGHRRPARLRRARARPVQRRLLAHRLGAGDDLRLRRASPAGVPPHLRRPRIVPALLAALHAGAAALLRRRALVGVPRPPRSRAVLARLEPVARDDAALRLSAHLRCKGGHCAQALV